MARYPVGHTAITWPFDLDGTERAEADVTQILAWAHLLKQLIRHVRVKDYDGLGEQPGSDGKAVDCTGYVNYTPVGEGVIDFAAMVRLLDEVAFPGWLMVELDGTPAAARPPQEAALVSKQSMERLLGAPVMR